MNETVYVAILNYKKFEVTIRCIEKIEKIYSQYSTVKIVVVDNGSGNDSVGEIRRKFSNENISYIELKDNVGFAKGNNIAINYCKNRNAKYCLLINSDIILTPFCIENMLDVFGEYDDAIIVGSRVLDINNKVTQSSQLFKTRIVDAIGIPWISHRKVVDESIDNIVKKVYSISGCCMMVDVQKFIDIGMFDENTFLYNEENILAERVYNSIYSEYITTKATVIHEHGVSSGRNNTFVYCELLKSTLYYWKEYRNFRTIRLYFVYMLFLIKICILKLKYKEISIKEIYKTSIREIRKLLRGKNFESK